jgi:hypothetical protein
MLLFAQVVLPIAVVVIAAVRYTVTDRDMDGY